MIGQLKLFIGGVILLALAGTHFWAYNNGRESVYAKLAADRIKILKDGRQIDEEVLRADDARLCELLGGCGVQSESQ